MERSREIGIDSEEEDERRGEEIGVRAKKLESY